MIAASNQPCDSLTPDWPKPLSHGPHSKFPHCPSLPAMLAPPPRRPLQGPPAPNWLLINDFSLSPCPPAEVRNVYSGQKLPCLVYYTRVSTTGGDGRGGGGRGAEAEYGGGLDHVHGEETASPYCLLHTGEP